jgi:hypothetical protein
VGGWEYQTSPRFGLAVARDRLPRGVELGESRTILQEGGDADLFPTQIKVFFGSDRLRGTAYVYGPGSPSAMNRAARGAGALGEVGFFDSHLVLGASFRRLSSSGVDDRQRFGGFARFGTGRWGVLAEHELVYQTSGPWIGVTSRYAGYTQLFVAPREWLVISVIGEQLAAPAGRAPQVFRWRPEFQARLSSHVTVTASARNDFYSSTSSVSRMYLVQVSLKTVR